MLKSRIIISYLIDEAYCSVVTKVTVGNFREAVKSECFSMMRNWQPHVDASRKSMLSGASPQSS